MAIQFAVRTVMSRTLIVVAAATAIMSPLAVAAEEAESFPHDARNRHQSPAAFAVLETSIQKQAIAEELSEMNLADADVAVAPGATYGQSIASFALAYLGYPYVWAGNGPYGFDCSGFTQFVVLNVMGIDIGHAVESQPWTGAWVNYGEWQPGDLIYFQNTYRPGISHAAIYIGDGQIIHAENEGTGVTIDSIYSSYYGPRYWGAVRIG